MQDLCMADNIMQEIVSVFSTVRSAMIRELGIPLLDHLKSNATRAQSHPLPTDTAIADVYQ